MRIAIDASRTTVARTTGTERYALQMICALVALDTPHMIDLYFRDPPAPDLFPHHPRVRHHVLPARRLWTHTRFAAAIAHDRPDVTWTPAHTLPFVFPGRGVFTAHDLGYRLFPAAHPARQRAYLDLTTRYSAARARIVITDSQATADDLTRIYRTPPDKIRVVYPGVDLPPRATPEEFAAVRARYGLPERYFLFVGTLQPRKNIGRLAAAYARWRERNPGDGAGLILAGARGWLFDEAWIAGIDGVTLTGYIDEADKGALFAGAIALVFPSLYEGFGFPVLEAMGCGTPVICSGTSSLPELAGEAALLVDPLEVEAIAAAMDRIARDEALRAELMARGVGQAARFTWDAAARGALAALEG